MNKQEKLILEIHNEFDTAQDRLLKQANEVLSKYVDSGISPIESVGERLAKVGFTSTPTVKKAEQIKKGKEAQIKTIVETREQAELIQYYQTAYPFLKFLTESELDRICKKYNLVYAPSDRYVQDVPEKNLTDIEQAQKLNAFDGPKSTNYFSGRVWCHYEYVDLKNTLNKNCNKLLNIPFEESKESEYSETRIAMGVLNSLGISTNGINKYIWIDGTISEVKRDGLFIAAPQTHFNTEGLKNKGLGFFRIFETEIKDPIVFRYVRGGIQVITKWGLEANDPALVVPVLN